MTHVTDKRGPWLSCRIQERRPPTANTNTNTQMRYPGRLYIRVCSRSFRRNLLSLGLLFQTHMRMRRRLAGWRWDVHITRFLGARYIFWLAACVTAGWPLAFGLPSRRLFFLDSLFGEIFRNFANLLCILLGV
jgi:hypothetical protein